MRREHSGAAQGDDDNTYVPRNMPAIGDLFDLFNFGRHREYEPSKWLIVIEGCREIATIWRIA
jgi:hypothetical protein